MKYSTVLTRSRREAHVTVDVLVLQPALDPVPMAEQRNRRWMPRRRLVWPLDPDRPGRPIIRAHRQGVAGRTIRIAAGGYALDAGRLLVLVLVGLPPLMRGTGYYQGYAPDRQTDSDVQDFRQWLLGEVAAMAKAA
jgi:DNA-binding transcriptional LysR family regulator